MSGANMEKEYLLEKFNGDSEKLDEFLKLMKNYNLYTTKFREKVNALLEPLNHEVLVGALFKEKQNIKEGE